MGDWVAALDGGGTKTAVAVATRRGEVALLPEGRGCNPQDGPGWEDVLREALGRAAAGRRLAAAVLGIPGRGEVPAQDAAVDALLAARLALPHEAMNDVALAHRGAFGGGEGVLLLAGTGSMAWARGPGGEVRVGGWGDAFGDEGSAHWIGREALALASRAMDGRAPGAAGFGRALRDRLGPGASGPFGPLGWLMAEGGGRAAVARVAREVDALAEGGDAEAQREALSLLSRAAGELALLARVAADRAGLAAAAPWVAAGGALRSPRLLALVAGRLGGPPEAPRLTALGGGLLSAATLAGWAPDAAWAAGVDARLRAYL